MHDKGGIARTRLVDGQLRRGFEPYVGEGGMQPCDCVWWPARSGRCPFPRPECDDKRHGTPEREEAPLAIRATLGRLLGSVVGLLPDARR